MEDLWFLLVLNSCSGSFPYDGSSWTFLHFIQVPAIARGELKRRHKEGVLAQVDLR
jgi:hypothetical protein